ncbi:MAG: hypothetical protein CVU95_07475 [Firmicutes bacterium HGW-Firmicutes-2]|jgi:uncharacterized membrane protein YczE|nr:MAG: hypothetical protein CVU95_07475 [Firmicutes bacterium HGW-Firmicutes-2]
MKAFIIRLLRLILGLFLFALGIVLCMNAQVGYAPWEVFHAGLAQALGMKIGMVVILSGFGFAMVGIIFGEKIGIGTLLNVLLIGTFMDILIAINRLPVMDHFLLGLLMLVLGLFIIALGSYFYIGSGFGAGPRDNLMVVIRKKTNLPIGICRGMIELTAFMIGWRLGGMFGIGTILSATGIGYCIQTTFKVLRFDPAKIKHETFYDTYQFIFKGKIKAELETVTEIT